MSRIPSHTIEDAPEAARPLLENLLQFSPTGKPLNLHAQMLAVRSGWGSDEVAALRSGKDAGGEKFARLLRVVREASSSSGRVADATWTDAVEAGWSEEELAEAFGCLGLTIFTAYFLNYADTEVDVPAAAGVPAGVGPSGDGWD